MRFTFACSSASPFTIVYTYPINGSHLVLSANRSAKVLPVVSVFDNTAN